MNNPSFNDTAAINSTTCGIFVGGWQMQWVPFTHAQFSPVTKYIIIRSFVGYLGLIIGKILLKISLTKIADSYFRVKMPQPPISTPDRFDLKLTQKDLFPSGPLTRSQELALFWIKFISYFYLGYFSSIGTTTIFPLLGID